VSAPDDIQGNGNGGVPDDDAAPSADGGLLPEGEERPRRSKKAKSDGSEVPSGWRSSRRGSKTAQRARKEAKSRETKERVAEGARDTGRKISDGFATLGKVIAGVALAGLIVILLLTAINGIARWNAKRIDDLENSPEALLEKARDNLLFIAEEEGRAVGFLALKVEGDREQIYGIAIPDAAFVEVPGLGFQRIGESYESGADVSLSAVSNFFTVPFATYAIVPADAYQSALTSQSVTGLLTAATETNLAEEDIERWDTIFETVEPDNVALLPLPVKPINVGSQTYFEPQREEVSDLLEQWWGVTIGGDEGVVRVIVYNGSGEPGIAGAVAQQLIGRGYRVVDTKNADSFDYEETQVIVQTSDPAVGDGVAEALGVGLVTVQEANQDVAEVIIIIGKDYKAPE
jgi:hypothetical protein